MELIVEDSDKEITKILKSTGASEINEKNIEDE
jgi:hypothetical protein